MTQKKATQKIIKQKLDEEMNNDYIDYAMSVIVSRALPDVRDGLKPVQRRILYGMERMGVTPDKPFKKSARIVGEVMGKYHPHGDSSIYNAMVRMAQDFSLRYPLVDGHGNFGSIDGDGAAAMRYTESRMSPFSLEMLRDIDKDTVDFVPNFDGEEKEPAVLPSRYPNLLVNGATGIAVGMATSIPPHNLSEVIDACIYLIGHKKAKTEDLMAFIKGPDFPTGGVIPDSSSLSEAYKTGHGSVVLRAKIKSETSSGKTNLVVTEIPFGVNKSSLVEKAAGLIKDKKIDEISKIADESGREGVRIVFSLKRGKSAASAKEKLFKLTNLQINVSINFLALVDNTPKVLGLKEILSEYLLHQKNVIKRRTEHELNKNKEKAHILEGMIIALYNLDKVIEIIRNSTDNAKKKLCDEFHIDEIQSQTILDIRLSRLQKMEIKKVQKEYREVLKTIKTCESVLSSDRKIMNVVKKELLEIKNKWGDERSTQIKT